jgi:type II secretory pathway pseudopilin PulG
MLLEVLVAMALFVSAAAVVGSAMLNAAHAVEDLRLETEATNLAQSVLTDLAAGRLELADTEPTTYDLDTTTAEDDSDKDFPWTYQIVTEDLPDATNLLRVTVIVRSADPSVRQSCTLTQWMAPPAPQEVPEEGYEEGFEEEGL